MESGNAWDLVEDAMERFNHGEYREAIDLFLKSVEASPSEPRMHFNLALALAKLGENMVALDVLKRGLDIDPHDKHALKLLSFLHSVTKEGHYDAKTMQKYSWIGHFLKTKDFLANYINFTIARSVIDAILASMSTFPYPKVESRGKPGQTRARTLVNTIQLDTFVGDICMCYARLSLPCLSGNKTDDVMKYILENYENLTEEDKGTGLLWVFEQGRRYYEDADYSEAARVLESLVAVEPTNLAILFYCAKAMRDSGELELVQRSLDYYKRILQLNYENALGWYDLSLSYAILGDFQKELFCLKRAFELGHSREDLDRITYLEGITAPVDPFA
ncbi:MAG: tetratricopeptide repeat protein [Candidatus Sigynarchaeota archaeon]